VVANHRPQLEILPLADFGAVWLGQDPGFAVIPGTCYATIGGATGPIGSFPSSKIWTSTMISQSDGALMATPSVLSPDGSSFSITWKSVGP
jgi:hypothetical protein